MAKRDYYEILNVSRNASDAEIKKAYRSLAMKYHPDRNANDKSAEEKFKEGKEAYDVLSDSQKRAAYDQFGHAGIDGMGAGPGGPGGPGAGNFSDIFDNIFSDFFGGGRGPGGSRAQRGSDLRYNLELTLEEAVAGKTVDLKIPSLVECDVCDGTGAKRGTKPKTCSTCQGAGQVRVSQGFFSVTQTCPTCQGRGTVIEHHCPACHGQGRREKTRTLQVKIPPGVDEGDRVRLSHEGEAGVDGGGPGDLYVQVSIKEHAIFTRKENDLYCEMPISIAVAALGGEIEVPTLGGAVKLKIPKETQSDKMFRLRGKGVKGVRSQVSGDLMCRVVVETPVNLTKKQIELLRQFDETMDDDKRRHSPKSSHWFDGMKKFFEELRF